MMNYTQVWSLEHTVVPGDTLYSIARQYNLSLEELQKLNNIEDPALLKVGMVLIVSHSSADQPTASLSIKTNHTVEKGDTYYNIAKRYNISVEELLSLNNRTADSTLRIGETLIVRRTSRSDSTSTPTHKAPVIWPASGDGGRTVTLPDEDDIEDVEPANTQIQKVSWPIEGSINLHTGRQGGVIISTPKDASVLSVSTGTVAFIGPYRELGNIIVIERTGGYLYIYGGLDAVFVTAGQNIDVGTALGVITGNNGKLIFSVHKDANIINPSDAPRN